MMTEKFLSDLAPARVDWLFTPPLRHIFAACAAGGAEARAVGGAVRNSLLDQPVADIDLAVNVPPETAETLLQAAAIKTVRTGFAHGTITAVVDGRGYELTSLRRDVSTDGRRATVAYTDAWAEDAARRDFTVNALYVAAAGKLYDYHGGLDDIAARRLRFIGDPAARLAEDYLRILRFFRFHAWYGGGVPDAAGLAACVAAAPGMAQLSRERVTQEWRKLLLAPVPLPVLTVMQAHDLFAQIIPLALDLPRLTRLLALPSSGELDFPLRFAALLPADPQLEPVLRAALRLSNPELQAVLALLLPERRVTQANLPERLYRDGAAYVRDRVLLQAAADPGFSYRELLPPIAARSPPAFPLTGQDLLALGMSSGPDLGNMLRVMEAWWIAAGFKPDRAACLAEAKRRQSQQ